MPKGKWLGPRRTRTTDEIPRGRADHRLVYRVDGDYILDNFALPLDSPTVLAATHVSLVDLSRNSPVTVEFEIPSMDASSFTVRATFLCSVTDAVAVVQEGSADVTTTLEVYLSGHYPLEEIGRSHNLDEINSVRRKLNARTEAFTTFMPPKLAGMHVEFASAQVLTPDDVKNFYGSVREETFRAKLARLQQQNSQQQQLHRTDFEQQEADLAQAHRNLIERKQLRHDLDRYQELSAEVSDDPRDVMRHALSTGRMTHAEYIEVARQMQQGKDEYDREMSRRQWEADRVDSRAAMQAKVDVVRGLIERGHVDTMAMHGLESAIDSLINGAPTSSVDGAATRPGLASPSSESADDNETVEVREEDGS
ncbi:hypothetical protein BJ987_003915 [Nocardia goodfellowii]|uniref:PE-PGRS family protein n=1 Tax=Nocardia goodfellowii TaxID=882446 RepID=A0ABS4QH34_9NOCA|nr:hypothetical protein [Nocardia goodfellowii]